MNMAVRCVWIFCLLVLNLIHFGLLSPYDPCGQQLDVDHSEEQISLCSILNKLFAGMFPSEDRDLQKQEHLGDNIQPTLVPANALVIPYQLSNSQNCMLENNYWGSNYVRSRKRRNLMDFRRNNDNGNRKSNTNINRNVNTNINRNINTNMISNTGYNMDMVPKIQQISPNILTELYSLIQAVTQHKLNNLSPELFTFISSYPNLPEVVEYIFQHFDLPNTGNITPQNIVLLLESLKSKQFNPNDQKMYGNIVSYVPSGNIMNWAQQNQYQYLIVPQNIKPIIVNFVNGIMNHQFVDISLQNLELILRYPDLEMVIAGLLKSFNMEETLDANQIILLLQFMRNIKLNITQLPSQSIIPLVLSLDGAEDLSRFIMNLVQKANPDNMLEIILEIVNSYGEKGIPNNLKAWFMSVPNGNDLIKYLSEPGEIKCEHVNGRKSCSKYFYETNVMAEMETEFTTFIKNILNHRVILTKRLIEFIVSYSQPQSFLAVIFFKNNFPQTAITPKTISLLLEIIKAEKSKGLVRLPIIPMDLLMLLVNMKDTSDGEELIKFLFNAFLKMPQIDIFQILLQIVSERREVPNILLPWILSLPQGQMMIEFMINPKQTNCKQNPINRSITCSKSLDSVKIELKLFIENMIKNKFNLLSFELLEFIKKEPNLQQFIEVIFRENHIPSTYVNPQSITLLLKVMKDRTTNIPVEYVPLEALGLLLNLTETPVTKDLIFYILNSMLKNPEVDILQILRGFMSVNKSQIPATVYQWILSLSSGTQIIQHLQNPKTMACKQDRQKHTIVCGEALDNIKFELKSFINNLMKNKLNPPSAKLLSFIRAHRNLQNIVDIVFKENKISQAKLNPQKVVLLLNILRDKETNNPVLQVPIWLLTLLGNMPKSAVAKDTLFYVMNSTKNNPLVNILQLLRGVLKNNDRKGIPPNVLQWILTLSSGQQITQHLLNPDDMQCRQDVIQRNIMCTDFSNSVKLELKQFILGINSNKFYEPSPKLLNFIIKQPNLLNIVQSIYLDNGITETVAPQTIVLLLDTLKHKQTNTPLKEIPLPLIELTLKMQGAQNLSSYLLSQVTDRRDMNVLQVLRDTTANGVTIPANLHQWFVMIPNGQQIERYIRKPEEMRCIQTKSGEIQCNDVLLQAKTELKSFIYGLLNGKLVDISPNLLLFLSYNPNISDVIEIVYEENNIPQDQIDSQTVSSLLTIIKDVKTHRNPTAIPNEVLELILNLEGAEELSTVVMNWAQNNRQIDWMQQLLLIMKDNRGVPENLLHWIMTLPNGQQILEYFQTPGQIVCTHGFQGDIVCNKIINENIFINIPESIIQELQSFVMSIAKNKLKDVSPALLKFVMRYPEPQLKNIIEQILMDNRLVQTRVNPDTIAWLLNIIRSKKTNSPIREIPNSVIKFVLELPGAQSLSSFVLNKARLRSPDLLQFVLEISRDFEEIPTNLHQWVLTQPNGKDLTEYFIKSGKIDCNQASSNANTCTKALNSEITSDVPANIKMEIQKFIIDINGYKLDTISPLLLEFIVKNPVIKLQSVIETIFQQQNIRQGTEINPQTINMLLNIIRDKQKDKPIGDIPRTMIDFIIKLDGAQDLSKYVLNGIQKNPQMEMMELFLEIIKNNGGSNIPPNLKQWILTLHNGKQIMDYLMLPGEIQCKETIPQKITCSKIVQSDLLSKVPTDIQTELQKFVLDLNNLRLDQISDKSLEYIKNYPDIEIQNIIELIFKMNYIPQTEITPEKVTQLLITLKNKKENAPLKDIPKSLIEFVIQLKNGKNLSDYILNYIKNNLSMDLMQLFLRVIKFTGGSKVPSNLQKWILKLTNGKEILEYLSSPGKIECRNEICNKIFQSTQPPNIPDNLRLEMEMFITNLLKNELIDISKEMLSFIKKQKIGDLQKIVEHIFKERNILQTNVTPFKVTMLLNLIKSMKTNVSLDYVPRAAIDLVIGLNNSAELSKYILNSIKQNLDTDMLQLLLTIIEENEYSEIPANLREWILTLKNGRDILQFLMKTGKADCKQISRGEFKCQRFLDTEMPKGVSESIRIELEKFIFSIEGKKYFDISPQLLSFIIKSNEVKLRQLIEFIFEANDIPRNEVDPEKIYLLLNLMKREKKSEPSGDVSQSMMNLVLKLSGAQKLSSYLLNSASEQQVDMLQLFLEVIEDNGGTKIPDNLRQWILTLAQGKAIIAYLELPGEINCERNGNKIKCEKLVVQDSANKESIKNFLDYNNQNQDSNFNSDYNTNINRNVNGNSHQ